jgi:hypothetical protein
MSRIIAVGLFAALALLETGCGCCHRQTARPAAPCCAPSGPLPPGAIPGPPPITSNFPPTGLAATYGR